MEKFGAWLKELVMGTRRDYTLLTIHAIAEHLYPCIYERAQANRCPICRKRFSRAPAVLRHLASAKLPCRYTLLRIYRYCEELKKQAQEVLSWHNGEWKCRICYTKLPRTLAAVIHVLMRHPEVLEPTLSEAYELAKEICGEVPPAGGSKRRITVVKVIKLE